MLHYWETAKRGSKIKCPSNEANEDRKRRCSKDDFHHVSEAALLQSAEGAKYSDNKKVTLYYDSMRSLVTRVERF